MRYYPVIDCYATIQGEGQVTGGEPIILIRFSTLKEWHNAHILTERETPYARMDLEKLLENIKEISSTYPMIKVVHLTGDEPCLNDIEALALTVEAIGLKVSLDTCGAFGIHKDTLKKLYHLSVGPKPGLHLNDEVFHAADELRLYVKASDLSFEHLARNICKSPSSAGIALLVPYSLSQEDIDATLALSLELGVRFHLPLYRTVYGFDKNLNGGEACNICNIQDGKTPITLLGEGMKPLVVAGTTVQISDGKFVTEV